MGGSKSGINLRKWLIALLVSIICLLYWFSLPKEFFDEPVCTILLAEDGSLLGARIAADEQWRFPATENIPEKFEKCIIFFEDKYFYSHPGFNPVSIYRAFLRNRKERRVVSGGSTISQQLIRLSRKSRKRSYCEKLIELILATRLEMRYSKKEILRHYISYAPFGGNVVGLDAAAWRYYGTTASQLSWGESATLAVLPNSPGLIYPGRNAENLLHKRNRLLRKLRDEGVLSASECELAMHEPIPEGAYPIPFLADHLLTRAMKEYPDKKSLQSSINAKLQNTLLQLAEMHHRKLKANHIDNMAILVVETSTGKVSAYIGNVSHFSDDSPGKDVDIITASRSTGSLLKPLLYAAMLSEGLILPNTLVKDIPVFLGDFHPRNFHRDHDGAVHARRVVSRSLNVPSVIMLQEYSVARFHSLLKKLGMSSIKKPPSHYGLSLILGGAEASLWDVAAIYTGLARMLINYPANSGTYMPDDDYHPPWYLMSEKPEKGKKSRPSNNFHLSASSIWFMLQAMNEVNRPESEGMWGEFGSSYPIAWKTGTSYGNRDAWAVGINPSYLVGVWAGNAGGEGRQMLTGIDAASPLMFDVFKQLESQEWFKMPYDDMEKLRVCRLSGHKASENCETINTVYVPRQGNKSTKCPYHKKIHLNPQGNLRVNSSCMPVSEMHTENYFVLPPVEEYYFRKKNAFYKSLPPLKEGCEENKTSQPDFALQYPDKHGKIILPKGLSGERNKVVLKAVHRLPESHLYWYLDDNYIGSTKLFHQLAISPEPGDYVLTITDQKGDFISRKISILPPG